MDENDSGAAAAQHLTFVYGETEKRMVRVSNDFVLPMEMIKKGLIDEGVEAVLEEKSVYANQVEGLENILNAMGYVHLREDKFEKAIKIFKLNTALFPQSANTWDSLGEGYLLAGNASLSIENYKKSMDINPGNQNAREKLQLLMN